MPIDVILNVYDLIDQTPICCGFFHTAIEILGTEWSFAAGGGVYNGTPRSAPDGRFRESIVLGSVESTAVANAALDRVRPEFHGDAYSLIFRNCNDFSSAYCKALLNRDIPGWINRLARLGRMWPVRVFLPPHMKGSAASTAQAPLLAGRQATSAPLFQGSGNTLSGSGPSSDAGGGGSSTWLSRPFAWASSLRSRLFGGRSSGGPDRSGSQGCVQPPSNAREIRAAAAAKRFGGGAAADDLESGGRVSRPMPNPWS